MGRKWPLRLLGHQIMQDQKYGSGNGEGAQVGGKARWHAPTLKRLDVDLTAGNARTSNEPPTRQTQFGGAS